MLLAGACEAIAPRQSVEVWDWAREHVVLPPGTSSHSGRLTFEWSPYMAGEWSPLWAYRRYSVINNVWAAQTGKTLMMYLTLLYDIAVDPGPGMIVYPDQQSARRRSKRHIRPILEASLPGEITEDHDDVQLLEYTLRSSAWVLAWAGSPSILAGEPVKHLKLDEEAKFPAATETEADAKRLALRRIVSYGEFGNAFSCTTPSREHLPGWRDWPDSTQCQYWVPCPSCCTYQVMYFGPEDRRWFEGTDAAAWSGGIKWDRDPKLTREQRCASAYYQCAHCAHHITTAEKNAAVAAGQWRARNPQARRYAAHLPSWYARWVPFADIVDRWCDAYKDDEARQDFVNSDCAVPYQERGRSADVKTLKAHILKGHHAGQIPPETVALYLTADVHDDHLRYRIRAWSTTLTSWGIEEGSLPPDMLSIDLILQKQFRTERGPIPISYGLIDARWRTDEVYQCCLRHAGVLWPCMGVPKQRELVQYVKHHVVADPEKNLPLGGEIIVTYLNDARWKDLLFSRWEVAPGAPGAWYVEEEASDAYFDQLQGEVKIEKKDTRGHPVYEWKQVGPNHALDVEKMQLAACTVFQLAALLAQPPTVAARAPGGPDQVYNPYTGGPVR